MLGRLDSSVAVPAACIGHGVTCFLHSIASPPASGLPLDQTLDLSDNGLSGKLPLTWATSLPSVKTLNLGTNIFTGALPPTWGSAGTFASLVHLDVGNNVLSGSLPTSIYKMPVLQWLDLSINTICECIRQSGRHPACGVDAWQFQFLVHPAFFLEY